ncbi:hypothetical protein ILYODFUR_003863 [Ilyodon furcidens]|uniref:Uncharacterized protein n=1 Tax=Ilyodon furcidens TaxID=33524 RepID=A0ABV0TRP3_9TELE
MAERQRERDILQILNNSVNIRLNSSPICSGMPVCTVIPGPNVPLNTILHHLCQQQALPVWFSPPFLCFGHFTKLNLILQEGNDHNMLNSNINMKIGNRFSMKTTSMVSKHKQIKITSMLISYKHFDVDNLM